MFKFQNINFSIKKLWVIIGIVSLLCVKNINSSIKGCPQLYDTLESELNIEASIINNVCKKKYYIYDLLNFRHLHDRRVVKLLHQRRNNGLLIVLRQTTHNTPISTKLRVEGHKLLARRILVATYALSIRRCALAETHRLLQFFDVVHHV